MCTILLECDFVKSPVIRPTARPSAHPILGKEGPTFDVWWSLCAKSVNGGREGAKRRNALTNY